MEHLSPAWITAFDRVVREHEGLRAASADRRVVVQFVVSDGAGAGDAGDGTTGAAGAPSDDGEVAYALAFDHGDNRVLAGRHPSPDLRLTTDRATAGAIASHAESAQIAFMSGRLRLGGDVRVLIANQDLLAGIDDCTGALRDATELLVPGAGGGADGA